MRRAAGSFSLDLRRCRRGLGSEPQGAFGPPGEPPVPAAQQRDDRRGEDAADERGVEQDAAAQGGGEQLGLGARAGLIATNARPRISAALVTRRARATDPVQ